MTSNRLFSRGFTLDFRRDIAPFVIYSLIFFVVLPLGPLTGSLWVTSKQYLTMHILDQMCFGAPQVFLILFSYTEAVHQFGFLFRKNETDFFHSLPQSRKVIFRTRYISGILEVLIPFLAFELITVPIVLTVLKANPAFIPKLLLGLAISIMMFVLSYTVNVLAFELTGKGLTGIFGMLILQFFFYVSGVVIEGLSGVWYGYFNPLIERFLPMDSVAESLMRINVPAVFASIGAWFRKMFYDPDSYYDVNRPARMEIVVPVCLLLIAGLYFLSRYLHQKRALERAGEAMAFPVTERPIQIILSVFGGLIGAIFFGTITLHTLWYLFGAIFGTVVIHVIVETIYTTDIRRAFSHPLRLAASLVIVLIIAILFK